MMLSSAVAYTAHACIMHACIPTVLAGALFHWIIKQKSLHKWPSSRADWLIDSRRRFILSVTLSATARQGINKPQLLEWLPHRCSPCEEWLWTGLALNLCVCVSWWITNFLLLEVSPTRDIACLYDEISTPLSNYEWNDMRFGYKRDEDFARRKGTSWRL